MSVFEILERKVAERMQKYRKIVVAYSAGKDSTVLLYLAKRLELKLGTKVYALHVHEGIKEHSDISRRIAEKVSEELGVPLIKVDYKEYFGFHLDEILPRFSLPPCAICGPMKRQIMNDVGLRLGAPIFTGHNVNDDVETLVINMFRGERRRFLEPTGGPGMVPRETPFIDVHESLLEQAAEELGLDYKKEPCPYAKLSMRRKIVKPNMFKRPWEKIFRLQKAMRVLKAYHVPKLKAPRFCKYCSSPASGPVCRVCAVFKELGILDERLRKTSEWRKRFRVKRFTMDLIGRIGLSLLLIARIPETVSAIRSKRAPEMPIAFIVIYLAASILLTIHARLINDPVFIILNAIASVLSGINLSLKLIFGRRT